MSFWSPINERVFTQRRNGLIAELREKGIKDEQVLQAIGTVPRHWLIDSALHHRAYEDSALPIRRNQTISQPYTVARQTELLNVRRGAKILEIGTGSGYQGAVLCEMGARLYSVERHRELSDLAKDNLREMGYRPMLKWGDGTLGWSAYAPYDGIVVTAGAPVVPDDLRQQLAINGVLVIPVGDDKKQTMLRIVRTGEQEFKTEEFADFKFVPLIGKRGWQE